MTEEGLPLASRATVFPSDWSRMRSACRAGTRCETHRIRLSRPMSQTWVCLKVGRRDYAPRGTNVDSTVRTRTGRRCEAASLTWRNVDAVRHAVRLSPLWAHFPSLGLSGKSKSAAPLRLVSITLSAPSH